MSNRFLAILAVVVLFFGIAGLTQVEAVIFEFNPADLLDFKHYSEGPSNQGGMFVLYEAGGIGGTPDYRSWNASEWETLDDMRNSLDDYEGIGSVYAYVLKSEDLKHAVTAWGQTLTTSGPLSGTAPLGWTALGGLDGGEAYLYFWEVDSDPSVDFLRQGEDIGTFSLSFTPNEAVTMGDNYTIYFAGLNAPGYVDAIKFDASGWVVESGHVPAFASESDSAFEGTLSLKAIPEPATFFVWAGLGLLMTGAAIWRRRKR